jgi:hypothetical protein
MLLGCKIDHEAARIQVPRERSAGFAAEHNLLFAACSAATGVGVEEMLHDLMEHIHANAVQRAALVDITDPVRPLGRDRCF